MSLTEFLLARIAEDETWANDSASPDYSDLEPGTPGHSGRILAECEAKRRIVEMHSKTAISWSTPDGRLAKGDEERLVYCEHCSFHEQYEGFNDYEEPSPCPTLRILALPYADHPDYQPEWRV
jgi:hypothetical protein